MLALGLAASGAIQAQELEGRFDPEFVIPSSIFVPPGFDSNDNDVQVVIAGTLPNSCYKIAPPLIKIDKNRRRIEIENRAYFSRDGLCLEVLVNYRHTLSFGRLPAGKYSVVFLASGRPSQRALATVTVAQATSSAESVDDYLYAQVDEIGLVPMDGGGIASVTLQGMLTSTCMVFKEARVLQRAARIIEILPIAEMEDRSGCQRVERPFEAVVPLDYASAGKVLIHVRSLNGQALNRVVNVTSYDPK